MIQKGTDPFCTILAASRYWGAVFFYRRMLGARGIPVSGAWISVFGSVSGGA